MTIYDPSGNTSKENVRYDMPSIYEGCIEKFTLMQEDYIELHFNLLEPVFFEIGCWTMWNGKKYYIIEAQQPSYDESTGGYNYELKFEAYYRAWQMKIYKYSPDVDKENDKDNGTREAEFSLTANLENQVSTFVRCLNKEGFSYNGNVFDSDLPDEDYYKEVKTMTYSSVNFIEALNQIADEWDAEWWVEGNVINFGKCQKAGEAIEFKLGENVVSMSGSKSETDYATRVYAFGSDKNLPKNYGKGDAVFTVDDNPQISEGFYYLKTDKPLYSFFFNKSDNIHNYEPEFDILNKGKIEIDNTPPIKAKTETETDIATIDSTSYLLATGKYVNKTFYIDRYKDNKEFCVLISYNFALIGLSSTSVKLTIKILLCGDKSVQSKTYEIGNNSVTINNFIAELYTESKDCVLRKKLNTDLDVSGNLSSQNISAFSFDIVEEQNVNIKILVGIEHVINVGPVGEATFGIALPSKSELAKKITLEMANKELYTNVIVNTESEKGIIGRLINDTALFPTYGGKFIRFENEAIANKVKGQKVTIDNIIESKLPSWYFDSEKDIQNAKSIKAIAERRLSLPAPYYVEASNVPFNSLVEKVLVFDDIYPRIKSPITKIEPKPQYVYEGDEKTDIKYTEYYIHTDDFTFDEDYKLDTADKLEIKFQTGALSGLTFEAIFHPKAIFNQEEPPQQYFQIVRQQFDGGIYLPSDAMHPELGDEFILIGWDASRIEDLGLIKDAEKRLAERTRFEIDKMNIDPTTYECTMFSDYTYGLANETLVTDDNGVVLTDERGIAIRTDESASGLDESNKNIFKIGQRVKLLNAAFFENGYRDSRIIGYERKMDIPYDSPVYMVGEKAIYSKFSSLEKSIKQIKNK